jgi:Arc/MetJ-type ribon-helix-helix transcriptional regulator
MPKLRKVRKPGRVAIVSFALPPQLADEMDATLERNYGTLASRSQWLRGAILRELERERRRARQDAMQTPEP